MKLLTVKLAVGSAPNSMAPFMSAAEFEFCCLRAGSTDGTLEGIEELDAREECRETIKFRVDRLNAREAYLCDHHGSTNGTLHGIADLDERENARKDFEEEQDRSRKYFDMKLKFERRRAENRKRQEAREKARKEAEARRREQARIREERLHEQEEQREGRSDVGT